MMPYSKGLIHIPKHRLTVPSCKLPNISPEKAIFENDFPVPQGGYVCSLEDIYVKFRVYSWKMIGRWKIDACLFGIREGWDRCGDLQIGNIKRHWEETATYYCS